MTSSYTLIPDRMAYHQIVWDIVRQIPPGQVSTYGRIAGLIPPIHGMSEQAYVVRGARLVGGAMAACPSNVPWQRVINSKGEVSQHGDGFGTTLQKELLMDEGVVFDLRGKINFDLYGWDGPDWNWKEDFYQSYANRRKSH